MMFYPTPILAAFVTLGQLIALAIAAAISVAASFIFRPKIPKPGIDNSTPTLTNRGAYLPIVIGRRRLAPIFAWVGDRRTKSSKKGTRYAYSGWHLLAVGPISKLHAIFADGVLIWVGPISNDTTPSGTKITTAKDGEFVIFWGDMDQPVNFFLGNPRFVGITSRWPGIAYIVWNVKHLNYSPTWPTIEYDIETIPNSANLISSDPYLSNAQAKGVNPAAAIVQVLSGPYPYGAGILKDFIDGTTLEALGVLMQAEFLPINLLIDGGQSTAQVIQTILQDMGLLMPQVGKRLVFMPTRATLTNPPSFTNEVMTPPDFERVMTRGDRVLSRVVFTFKSENDNYQDYDIKIEDDAEAEELSNSSPMNVPISTATNLYVASIIARRRTTEALGLVSGCKVSAIRGARTLVPGQVFKLPGFGVLRVLSRTTRDDSAEVVLSCMIDNYGKVDTVDQQAAGGGGNTLTPVEPDLAFTFLQIPNTDTIMVFRVRNDGNIEGAFIWISADTGAFNEIGNQDTAAAGGVLTKPIDTSGTLVWTAHDTLAVDDIRQPTFLGTTGFRYIVITAGSDVDSGGTEPNWNAVLAGVTTEVTGRQWRTIAFPIITSGVYGTGDPTVVDGPVIESMNDDIQDVLDLSGDFASWSGGVQLALIGDELFFLESIAVVAEPEWVANKSYPAGVYIQPTAFGATGLRYKSLNAGKSGAIEPYWTLKPQGNTTDVPTSGTTIQWEPHDFTWNLGNMIRARNGTVQAAHTEGDIVYIIAQDDLITLESSLIRTGTHLCLKTQPFTIAAVELLSAVTAVCKDISNSGPDPIPVTNFRIDSNGNFRRTSLGDNRITS